MTALLPIPDLNSYVETRASWQSIGEHVLTKARWCATTKIGLRPRVDGFGTPHFGDDNQLWVTPDGLHHGQHGDTKTVPITTLRAAAEFAAVEAGAPSAVFTPTTPVDLDAVLVIDRAAAEALAAWYNFASEVLTTLRLRHIGNQHVGNQHIGNQHDAPRHIGNRQDAPRQLGLVAPSLVQLWPEHFDVAVDFGDAEAGTRANYGASPGDAAILQPYLYVGPWDLSKAIGAPDDAFWNQPWGATMTYDSLLASADPYATAAAFFEQGTSKLAANAD